MSKYNFVAFRHQQFFDISLVCLGPKWFILGDTYQTIYSIIQQNVPSSTQCAWKDWEICSADLSKIWLAEGFVDCFITEEDNTQSILQLLQTIHLFKGIDQISQHGLNKWR